MLVRVTVAAAVVIGYSLSVLGYAAAQEDQNGDGTMIAPTPTQSSTDSRNSSNLGAADEDSSSATLIDATQAVTVGDTSDSLLFLNETNYMMYNDTDDYAPTQQPRERIPVPPYDDDGDGNNVTSTTMTNSTDDYDTNFWNETMYPTSAPTMTTGSETKITITRRQDPCSICPIPGDVVMNLDALVSDPITATSGDSSNSGGAPKTYMCALLEERGRAGLMDSTECGMVRQLLAERDPCGCAVPPDATPTTEMSETSGATATIATSEVSLSVSLLLSSSAALLWLANAGSCLR